MWGSPWRSTVISRVFVGQMACVWPVSQTPASTLLANPRFASTTKHSAYAQQPPVLVLTHALEAMLQWNSSTNVSWRHSLLLGEVAHNTFPFSYDLLKNWLKEIRISMHFCFLSITFFQLKYCNPLYFCNVTFLMSAEMENYWKERASCQKRAKFISK